MSRQMPFFSLGKFFHLYREALCPEWHHYIEKSNVHKAQRPCLCQLCCHHLTTCLKRTALEVPNSGFHEGDVLGNLTLKVETIHHALAL